MDFLQLEYFCTVAQVGNISKAAEHLHISQPSLSQTIAKLEKSLGTSLLDRSPRGITLTEAGQRFFGYAKQTLRNRYDIERELHDLQHGISGEIRIKSNVMSYVIARLFFSFHEQYPHTSIRISAFHDDTGNTMHYQPADLIITSSPSALHGTSSVELVTEELFAAVSVEHPLAGRKQIRLEELAEDYFIIQQMGELREIIDRICATAGFEPKILLEGVNTNTIFGLVSMNMGVSIFPHSWKRIFNNRIVMIPIRSPVCTRTVRMSWQDNYLGKAAASFRDYLIENMRAQVEREFWEEDAEKVYNPQARRYTKGRRETSSGNR